MKLKNHSKYSFAIFLIFFMLFSLLFNQKVYGHDSFTERSIRGTEVIHVVLNKNSTSSDVFNYIKTNINPSYNGSVSSTTAYNKEKGGDMHWYIKNDDEEFIWQRFFNNCL
ncbi:hypothetical protein [Candidatus Phytoplasma meliae]|uniref:Uncharacterized protein n=1 Tax=Candidatus Phytoplasma meliae TaxID=1848402 RepID=A0ABS5CYG1_9MOLU|nr:hypothetical protein [Candidatus Phytoplasma meliae]MBP5836002.1 hypothetical protein [Candidatus Phytoplasma meliae]